MPTSQPRLPGTARDGKRVARARRGFDTTVTTLVSTGVVDRKTDAALIAAGRTLADQIDAEATSPDCKPGTVGYLVGGMLPIVAALRAGREATQDADPFAEFIADIHSPKMGNTTQ